MDPKILQLLKSADNLEHIESPPGFDWKAAIKRVDALGPKMERIVGHSFVVTWREVQDASFFTDLSWRQPSREDPRYIHTVIAVRFSTFGDLFTTWNSCPPDIRLSKVTVQKIVATVAKNDFVYVSPDDLDEPYTGANPAFADRSWWYRFFDYL